MSQRIVDARERERATKLEWSWLYAAHRVMLPREQLARVRGLVGDIAPVKNWRNWLPVAFFFLYLLGLMGPVAPGGGFGRLSAVILIGFAATAVLSFWRPQGLIRLDDSSQLAGALVQIGRCGVCAYDIREQVAEADGCVVCPECGAAWREEDVESVSKNGPKAAASEAKS